MLAQDLVPGEFRASLCCSSGVFNKPKLPCPCLCMCEGVGQILSGSLLRVPVSVSCKDIVPRNPSTITPSCVFEPSRSNGSPLSAESSHISQ